MTPPGFHYRADFITEPEERTLLDGIAGVAFSDSEMRGVVARRRSPDGHDARVEDGV
jgi:hypothetical protein